MTTDTLYFDTLDEDLFPELQPRGDKLAIAAKVLPPMSDRRVPAPPKSVALLVVFRLNEPPPFKDPLNPPPGWRIDFDRRAADGTVRRHSIAMWARPLDGNFAEFPRLDPNLPPTLGAIYRGALWADLTPLYARKVFQSGLAVDLAYMQQASIRITLP